MTILASCTDGKKEIEFIRPGSPATILAKIYNLVNDGEKKLFTQIAGAKIIVLNEGSSKKACLKAEQMGEELPEESLCELSTARQNAVFEALAKYRIVLVPGRRNEIVGITMIR